MATRYRPTFLLQVLVLVASVGAFVGLMALVDGPPLVVALIVLAAWAIAVELEVLPRLVEWWLLRWAARHAPASSIFYVDLQLEEQRARDERRREIRDNPSLW
jgi:pimeloyl-ACP methyl ester carboxylesterase